MTDNVDASPLPQTIPSPEGAMDEPRHNLPAPLTSLIGRQSEISKVKRLLATARLVTLTGPGGCGKTRLALEVAAELAGSYADGVRLIELAPASDVSQIAQKIASAVGLHDYAGDLALVPLSMHLASRQVLLVLDNCEHMLEGCAVLSATLLRACPRLQILSTSRELLGAMGEAVFRVPCLSVPHAHQLPAEEADLVSMLPRYGAVRLFIERASLVRPDFALSERNAMAVARICMSLNGIPLALELAAARVRSLSTEQIAARLDDHLRLLVGGGLTLPGRHRTMRAALDWSYDLLNPEDQTLLARLSVFTGGWTLEAAESVASGDILPPGAILDLLSRLVDRSLVLRWTESGTPRYGMLEMVRQYDLERLERSGEAPAVRNRHAAFFMALAEEAERHILGADPRIWLDRLALEHENLLSALQWTLEKGDVEMALRLTTALGRYWWAQGSLAEGQAWLTGALTASSGTVSRARSRALRMAAFLARCRSDLTASRSLLAESLAQGQGLGDRQGMARSLIGLAIVASAQGDHRVGTALLQRGLGLARELADKPGVSAALAELARAALARGEWTRARGHLEESLALRRDLESKLGMLDSLRDFACLAAAQGKTTKAAQLFGAEEGLRESLSVAGPVLERNPYHQLMDATRRALEPNALAELWSAGRGMTLEQAIAVALASERSPQRAVHALTRRERQVSALVAQGLTNAEIAAALVLSERTVETHVGNILGKLGFSARTQIASWALKQGVPEPASR